MNITENLIESFSDQMQEIVRDFFDGQKRITWTLLRPDRLRNIWRIFGTKGIVWDEKGVDEIISHLFFLLVRIEVCNVLQGHSEMDPRHECEELENLSDDEWERMYFDFLTLETGQGILSDYGPKQLWPIVHELENEKDYVRKICLIDRFLNVVHCRGDLAAYFIEGGSSVLREISVM